MATIDFATSDCYFILVILKEMRNYMTQEERQTCARLYFLYSGGEPVQEHKWNDKGANELYRMILKVQNCSTGIAWLPKVPNTMPTIAKQAATYLVQYLYKSLKKQYALNKSKTAVVPACVQSHFLAHRSLILSAIAGF
jgi:hypothetical protein